MKIAVIGSGISGLGAAYYLSKKHHVDLFEKEDHFGGHSNTVDFILDGKKISVDVGFIVFTLVIFFFWHMQRSPLGTVFRCLSSAPTTLVRALPLPFSSRFSCAGMAPSCLAGGMAALRLI